MLSDTSPITNQAVDQQAIFQSIAKTFDIQSTQVAAFANLYDEGASVPFIARYRKDKTGGLDDTQLRHLETALIHERDMAERRLKTLDLIRTQTPLTEDIYQRVAHATSRLELDEIYQPYRPKRRSLATKATLAGLDSIANQILSGASPTQALLDYTPVDTITDDTGDIIAVDYHDKARQLAGISAIIIEQWSANLAVLDTVRTWFCQSAHIHSSLISEDKRELGEKFKDYFEHSEPIAKLSSHRLLAMLRGRQSEILTLKISSEPDDVFVQKIATDFLITDDDERGEFLQDCAKKLWQDKWRPQIEHRLLTEQREHAEQVAIDIFAGNLKHLLMAAPAGQKVILGVDPGYKNGIKMAVIDGTGDVIITATVYPFASSKNNAEQAKITIKQLIQDYQVDFVAIGNGTASRESEQFIKEIVKEAQLSAVVLVVNESGASVYSASELASSELCELDVSLRGAVSIARRLQDPLSELVKVEPKAIGVGQYQHDVNQSALEDSLNKVTEDCVNAVGVDVNTASPAILAHIAGLNKNVAQQIVNYRRQYGAFDCREDLKRVPRFGTKTFEQSAGFLRIKSGSEPLDATGVHPESYAFVYQLLQKNQLALSDVLGNQAMIDKLSVGMTPLSMEANVLAELAKPAHDPRGSFQTAQFAEGIHEISDLATGMVLEGVVTNVTAFGCFVDIGVHQDGLVHISEMSNDFITNPSDIVKPADIVKVRVLSVDEARARIALSMKQEAATKTTKTTTTKNTNSPKKPTTKTGSLGVLLKQAGIKN